MRQSEALRILHEGCSVFLTGAPGSGKTYVLNRFVAAARESGAHVAVTASTGIAATHINGRTIHSWSGVGVSTVLTDSLLRTIRSRRRRKIQEADVLVIDEVSMMQAWLFDMVDRVCRSLRNRPEPFGGLQVVLSGDFFQLPPVSRATARGAEAMSNAARASYDARGRDPDGFITQSRVWDELSPVVCYLDEQHRQDDGRLLGVLTDIRGGLVDDGDRDALAGRVGVSPEDDAPTVHLFPMNRQADSLNATRLAMIDSAERGFDSQKTGPADLVRQLSRNMLAPEHLSLKKGAAVMALRNDADGQYVNGSIGTVRGFASTNDGGWPVVHFDNGNVCTMKPASWEMMDGDSVLASVKQVPLRCAWAITIHKSQGMTLDTAVMDLRRSFAPGMGYVALSRVESMDGLFLEGISERAFAVSPAAVDLDGDLRARSEDAVAALNEGNLRSFMGSSGAVEDQDEFMQSELF
ncbi:PIF1 family DEAD/DEAH box helicase [uncultured Bifidobacterium sp.]|uniref:PIF1 family DEAD/DEAH box helicase n=1 Tax=uncultured Bifidobacterium sp. TaxID=165187 RepID=UPI0026372A62|nr:PIF1 family DEAD/DEAH box helicase [uncultured Bifidobacterium sp.]